MCSSSKKLCVDKSDCSVGNHFPIVQGIKHSKRSRMIFDEKSQVLFGIVEYAWIDHVSGYS
jgi:hypothetical protein